MNNIEKKKNNGGKGEKGLVQHKTKVWFLGESKAGGKSKSGSIDP